MRFLPAGRRRWAIGGSILLVAASLAIVLSYGAPAGPGCGGPPGATGMLEARLASKGAPPGVKSIVVTISRVEAHVARAGWSILSAKPVTIDLLTLDGATPASLGVGQLPTGRITQLRLFVAPQGPNHVITADGVQHPLEVPSGVVSGIVVGGGFKHRQCNTGVITFELDGRKSLATHPKGPNGPWILRPVIRLKAVESGQCGRCPGKRHQAAPKGGDDDDDEGDDHDDDDDGDPTCVCVCDGGAPAACQGIACPPGQTCQNGACVVLDPCQGIACPPGQVCQSGACVVSDPCVGIACPPGQTCQNGACVVSPSCANVACPPGQTCDNGVCVF